MSVTTACALRYEFVLVHHFGRELGNKLEKKLGIPHYTFSRLYKHPNKFLSFQLLQDAFKADVPIGFSRAFKMNPSLSTL